MYSVSKVQVQKLCRDLLLRMRTITQTTMALRRGAVRLNALFSTRPFFKCASFNLRSFADHASSPKVASSAPETSGDHVLYTPEHFALKDSLKKVRVAANEH